MSVDTSFVFDLFLLFIYRANFDKLKADIRLMKEELLGIERYRVPKERSLAQCASNLEAMLSTRSGLESELHQVGIVVTCSEIT